MVKPGLVVGALVSLSACVLPQTVPEAAGEFVAKGEVRFQGHGAAFDAVRVRSAIINVTKRTDGSWGGTFDGQAIDVSVSDDAIHGANLTMSRKESSPGKLIITGQFQAGISAGAQGRIYRFELDTEQAKVRSPSASLTLAPRAAEADRTSYGPNADLVLLGDAGAAAAPWPQLAFALLAAFR